MTRYFSSKHRNTQRTYVAISENSIETPDGVGYPRAEVIINHKPAHASPTFDVNASNAKPGSREWLNSFENYARTQKQPELFYTRPPETTIYGTFAHSSMRHTIPIMLSYDHLLHNNPYVASSDISKHSQKMLTHAKELGLPVQSNPHNQSNSVMNNMDFNDEGMVHEKTDGYGYINEKEIPAERIQDAKKHYRALRSSRRSTSKVMSPQFEQLRLPGMEG
jgi:hypothetical protein